MIVADGFKGINGIFFLLSPNRCHKEKVYLPKASQSCEAEENNPCGWTIFELLIVIMIHLCEQINLIIRGFSVAH